MDSNKDEAERCVELAERYIKEKKLKDAEKFLRKAKKLYPTQKAEDLLTKVKSMSNQNMKTESEPSVRKRHSANKESSHNHNTEYTKEQLEAVKRIKKCKDYYEILGVSKDATDSEIKKAYKKLALLLHPDKNKAPGASEAFKAVGNAIAILTDVEKRKQYDLYGPEEERVQTNPTRPNRPNQSRYNYTRGFEADLTAEELFNMFFGGGIPQQEFYVRRPGRWNRQQEAQGQNAQAGNGNYTTFIQSLLLMLLILISMMSSYFMSDPVYSLHANSKYTVARKTKELNVPYYVKENFQNDYQGSIQRLETSVQDEYILNLRQACYRERNYKDALLWKARSFQDQEMYYKARNIETPSCQKLQDLQVT